MKLIAGHRYLKDAAGSEIVPYTEQMAKTLGIGVNPLCTWTDFIQGETVSNDMQLAENEKIVARKPLPHQSIKNDVEEEKVIAPPKPVVVRPTLAKPVQSLKSAIKPVAAPVVTKKMEHMDIRADMQSDLAALD